MTGQGAKEIPERVAAVRDRILAACRRAGREPAGVTLVAVSKTQPAEAILAAWEAGVADFGENRVQEALAKLPAVLAITGRRARFHLIGHLQTNKVAAALDLFSIVHSIDSGRLLRKVAARAEQTARPLSAMIQVNVSGEASKFGIAPEELPGMLSVVAEHPIVEVSGLMTVPPLVEDPNLNRPLFAMLRELAAKHGLHDLSMGMTDDYEVAIEEGATHVRVGRAIFGERRA